MSSDIFYTKYSARKLFHHTLRLSYNSLPSAHILPLYNSVQIVTQQVIQISSNANSFSLIPLFYSSSRFYHTPFNLTLPLTLCSLHFPRLQKWFNPYNWKYVNLYRISLYIIKGSRPRRRVQESRRMAGCHPPGAGRGKGRPWLFSVRLGDATRPWIV